MPTREQIESVVAEIERVQSGRSADKPWASLAHGEKYVALNEIGWPGFTRRQEMVVIGRILADKPPELWMEGINGHDDDAVPSHDELRALAEEIRQDEFAARVRDYGEADAATYDARMAEAYRHRAEALGLAGSPEQPPITDAELERLVGELERGWVAKAEPVGDFTAGLERGASDVPSRVQRLNTIGERERRAIAAYDAEVAGMTHGGPGEESGLARAWRAGSERARVSLLADLAADHGVEEEVFVRTAHRVMGWPETTAEQREWMADAWAQSMDFDPVPRPPDEFDRDTPRPESTAGSDRRPKDSLFPSDEPIGFQVWHKQGQHYEYVASIESNALGAIMMTTHGFMGYQRWQDNPGVSPALGEHRSTDIGDVLIGRDGQTLEIAAEDGLRLKPIASIDRFPSDAKGTRSGPEETPLERVERELRDWKTYVPAAWEGGVSEVDKLRMLEGEMDWSGVSAKDKQSLLAREVDFTKITPDELDMLEALKSLRRYVDRLDAVVAKAEGEAHQPSQTQSADPPHRAPSVPGDAEIGVLPGHDNPVYRGERTFDIHDATGKIGHLAGYMGGPWSDSEFRITHVEISEPGRSLTPGQWKGVLGGLREQLPDAEYLGGNRTGINGDLSPAYEKLVRLSDAEPAARRRVPSPGDLAGQRDAGDAARAEHGRPNGRGR
jgi:hypothetical protein